MNTSINHWLKKKELVEDDEDHAMQSKGVVGLCHNHWLSSSGRQWRCTHMQRLHAAAAARGSAKVMEDLVILISLLQYISTCCSREPEQPEIMIWSDWLGFAGPKDIVIPSKVPTWWFRLRCKQVNHKIWTFIHQNVQTLTQNQQFNKA